MEYVFLGIGIISLLKAYFSWEKKWLLLGGILLIIGFIITKIENNLWILQGILYGFGTAFCFYGFLRLSFIYLPGYDFIQKRKIINSDREKNILLQFLEQRKKKGISYRKDIDNLLKVH